MHLCSGGVGGTGAAGGVEMVMNAMPGRREEGPRGSDGAPIGQRRGHREGPGPHALGGPCPAPGPAGTGPGGLGGAGVPVPPGGAFLSDRAGPPWNGPRRHLAPAGVPHPAAGEAHLGGGALPSGRRNPGLGRTSGLPVAGRHCDGRVPPVRVRVGGGPVGRSPEV